jgi:hypothetical protein
MLVMSLEHYDEETGRARRLRSCTRMWWGD